MSEYKRLTERGLHGIAYPIKGKGLADLTSRLAKLEDKIENGTLVELPCRLGEHFVIKDYGFNRFKVEKVEIVGYNFSPHDDTIFPVDSYDDWYLPNKVFDTEEAAEARLKELQVEG